MRIVPRWHTPRLDELSQQALGQKYLQEVFFLGRAVLKTIHKAHNASRLMDFKMFQDTLHTSAESHVCFYFELKAASRYGAENSTERFNWATQFREALEKEFKLI